MIAEPPCLVHAERPIRFAARGRYKLGRAAVIMVIHVLKSRCRWKDCPAVCGPPTTIYNRFNRWSWKGLCGRIFVSVVL